MIPFNKPYLTGDETKYISEAVKKGKISGDGDFTKKCQTFFENQYGFKKCLLTTSCTDALEMAAILANIKIGDEVIVPSYTFVSTALAFERQGAKIVFVDSQKDNPNLDTDLLEALITKRTKAIVPVHYAGMACNMDIIMDLASKYNLLVIEDAAQAIDSYYTNRNGEKKSLGSIGHLATFSFHETKNIISGEGGMLAINDEQFNKRAEIIWEKGTNRAEFFRGEVNKYGWVDTGSSFLPSEITAAFLWAQIENIGKIQTRRILLWQTYFDELSKIQFEDYFQIFRTPDYATNNAHMFYIVCKTNEIRSNIITRLKEKKIHPVFHYLSLHKSEYYKEIHGNRAIPYADYFSDNLLRLPFYYDLSIDDVKLIVSEIKKCLQ